MGIEGRDYYRDSARYTERLGGGWGWAAFPPVCKWLIIVNVVVFILQVVVTRSPSRADREEFVRQHRELYKDTVGVGDKDSPELYAPDFVDFLPKTSRVQEWFELDTQKVLHGQVWRLLTTAFCHDRFNMWHIVMNMLFFYWFGLTLERMYGSREFLLFYLAAAVAASLAYIGLEIATGGSTPAIGASGAVMAVTMLYAMYYPRHVIYILFIIPVQVRWLVLLYVIFDLHPVLLALGGNRVISGVAHAAHLGGLAFGFAYWKWDLRLSPFLDWLRMPRWSRLFGPRRKLRVFQPAPDEINDVKIAAAIHVDKDDDTDARLDEVLRKIHDHGEASLTDDERQVLQAASRRYQKRNR